MTSRLRRVMQGEEGFALLVVMGGMISLTLVVLATLAYVANSLPVTRRGQDAAAAVQAAQAGIDDYLARLSTCDSYWSSPCSPSDVNTATTGWAPVPFSSTASPAQYHYEVVRDPSVEAGLLRLRSTGRILRATGPSTKRTLVVDLRKKSLLEYIYYTDHEASDPASLVRRYPARRYAIDPTYNNGYSTVDYAGVTAAEAAKCNRYWYATPTTPRRNAYVTENYTGTKPDGTVGYFSRAYSCDIQFAPIDTLDGPVYTKDAILLNNPLFKGPVSTRWAVGSTPAPDPAAPYRIVDGGVGPQSAGFKPEYSSEDVTLPPSNDKIQDKTDPAKGGQQGCGYTGPTRIVLKNNGTMDVTSPLTTRTNAPCTRGTATAPNMTSAQNVPIPANGVVYVDASTASCGPANPKAFTPAAGDVTPYDCAAGDVFVEGVLSGKLTIAAKNDITVTGNVAYKNGTTGADVLGLVADGDVEIYHPVKCVTAPAAGYSCPDLSNIDVGLTNVTVSAAILSVKHSFTVQNFDEGAKLGNLTVIGGVYQYFRGAVGTGGSSGTGYGKDYHYDTRLKSLPPPSFVDPVAAPWLVKGYAEVDNPLPGTGPGKLPA